MDKNRFKLKFLSTIIFFLLFTGTAFSAPRVLFVDVQSGPKTGVETSCGTYISIFGKGFGATQGSSTVEINGSSDVLYKYWGQSKGLADVQQITVQPCSGVTTGSIQVIVNSVGSNTNFVFTVTSDDVFFISPSGSDAAAGDINNPWETIEHAFDNAQTGPGDTIVMRAGTHTNFGDGAIPSGVGGNASFRKHLIVYPGETADIIRDRGLRPGADYVTYQGISFGQNSVQSYILNSGNFVNIFNNIFSWECQFGCVNQHGDDVNIFGNRIHNMNPIGTLSHGMYIHGNVRNKIFWNHVDFGSQGYGVHVFEDQNPSIHDDIEIAYNLIRGSTLRSGGICRNDSAPMSNISWHDNLIYDNAQNGIRCGGTNLQSLEIYNNTFYNNGTTAGNDDARGCISIRDFTNATIEVKNNICWAQSGVHFQDRENSPNITLDNNLYGPGSINNLNEVDLNPVTGDPLFINPGSDFRLSSGSSPAVDSGVDLTSEGITRDYDYLIRPIDGDLAGGAQFDIGAHEFDSGAPPPAGAVKLVITSTAQSITAGNASAVVNVQAQDISSTLDTGYSGTANLTSGSGTMRFDTSSGGPFDGSITSISITSGTGSFYFKDTIAGVKQITVSDAVGGLSPANQNETITADTETDLLKISGDNQTGTVLLSLASPFVVQVNDTYGNPVSGVTVNWAVTGGGGSIAPSSNQTASNGRASATGTLGATPGTDNNTYTATVSGLTGSPQTFTASANASGSPAETTFQNEMLKNDEGYVDWPILSGTNCFHVEIRDLTSDEVPVTGLTLVDITQGLIKYGSGSTNRPETMTVSDFYEDGKGHYDVCTTDNLTSISPGSRGLATIEIQDAKVKPFKFRAVLNTPQDEREMYERSLGP